MFNASCKRVVLTVTTLFDNAVSHINVRKFGSRWEARNSRDELLGRYELIYDGGTSISDISIYTTGNDGVVIHAKITPSSR